MSLGGDGAYRPGLAAGRRTLVSDVDGTLLDGAMPGEGAAELGARMRSADAALVLASGRDLELAAQAAATLAAAGLPWPAALVCGVGAEVHVWEGGGWVVDEAWERRLASSGFDAALVRAALAGVPHLSPQPARTQGPHKVSYYLDDPANGPAAVAAATRALAERAVAARLVPSAGRYLDVLPEPASKGGALLRLVERFGLAPRDVAAAGDSGNDRELLVTAADAGMVAVLVANHEPELADLASHPGVLLASRPHCAGVLEGLEAAGW